MQVTLKEIADRVGVSRPLVSFVLNNARGNMAVSVEKRQKIIDVAHELGYIPNLSAQVLSGKSSRTIGLVNVCIIQYSVAIQINHFLNYAPHFGYQLLLDPISHPLRELGAYRESMRNILSRSVEGLIFIGSPPPEILEMCKLPSVIAGLSHGKKETTGEFDFAADLQSGGYLAGRHFLKHGHRKIVLLCTNYNSAHLKLAGLRQAWAEAGLPPENVGMIEAFEEPAEQRILEYVRDRGFTCGLTTNDFIGARLMQFLDRNGLRVPEDFALIGYDGDAFAYLLNPPLTSVVSSFEENARLAFELLVSRIELRDAGPKRRNQLVKPSMFMGGSCGCPWEAPEKIVRKRDMLFLRENMPDHVIHYDEFVKLHT